MMKKYMSGFVLIAVALLFANCTGTKAPELQSVEIMELSRTAGEGTLKVNLTYLNPNKAELKIKMANIEGMINQRPLAPFKSKDRVALPGKEDKVIEVSYSFQPDDIYPGFLSNQFGAIGSKRVRISLNGSIEFIKDDKSIDVPLEYSEVYKIPG
ncbi:MAG: hypothetical protein GY751_20990 [Bacteroidetes bacterium]|nr:hypothetical protein [Bacteroidota bacterium]